MLDNYDLFARHEAEQEEQLSKLPVCDSCGRPIQDDTVWDVGGDIFCEDCARTEFMHPIERYMED